MRPPSGGIGRSGSPAAERVSEDLRRGGGDSLVEQPELVEPDHAEGSPGERGQPDDPPSLLRSRAPPSSPGGQTQGLYVAMNSAYRRAPVPEDTSLIRSTVSPR